MKRRLFLGIFLLPFLFISSSYAQLIQHLASKGTTTNIASPYPSLFLEVMSFNYNDRSSVSIISQEQNEGYPISILNNNLFLTDSTSNVFKTKEEIPFLNGLSIVPASNFASGALVNLNGMALKFPIRVTFENEVVNSQVSVVIAKRLGTYKVYMSLAYPYIFAAAHLVDPTREHLYMDCIGEATYQLLTTEGISDAVNATTVSVPDDTPSPLLGGDTSPAEEGFESPPVAGGSITDNGLEIPLDGNFHISIKLDFSDTRGLSGGSVGVSVHGGKKSDSSNSICPNS